MSQGAHGAPRRERRGATGPPQADAGGAGRSPVRLKTATTLAAAVLLAGAAGAAAQDAAGLRLRFPARCELGADCWLRQYMDLDAARTYRDYRCGLRASEGHAGTDIAPTDPDGPPIAVLAAAPGTVVGARDGMDDSPLRAGDDSRRGRECGNGVRVDHGGGWTSQYCHLRRGSVTVGRGDPVAAGDVLGAVGSSGESDTPHVHFQLERDGEPVDPFSGARAARPPRCDAGGAPAGALWQAPRGAALAAYRPTVVFRAGLTTAPPDRTRARHEGYPAAADVTAPALVGYVLLLGAAGGTTIDTFINAPGGERLFERRAVVERDFAEYFNFAGRPRPGDAWPRGTYRARFVVSGPDGDVRAEAAARLELE